MFRAIANARMRLLSAMNWSLSLAAAVGIALVAHPTVHCGETTTAIASIPVESFASRPQISEMHLSPNGKELAVLRQVKEGGHGLFVIVTCPAYFGPLDT